MDTGVLSIPGGIMGHGSNYGESAEDLLAKAIELRDQLGEMPKMDRLRKVFGIGAPKARRILELMESKDLAANTRIARSESDFESLKGSDDLWSARDLMDALGYARWENFANVIEEAMISCEVAGSSPTDNFREVRNMGDLGYERQDYRVTRLAAYLISMAGDPRKQPIALARMYFAQREVARVEAESERYASDPLYMMITKLIDNGYEIKAVQQEVKDVRGEVHSMRADVERSERRLDSIEHNTGWETAISYAALHGGIPGDKLTLQRLGAKASQVGKSAGMKPETVRDLRYGTVNMWPVRVWDEAAKQLGFFRRSA